MDTQQSQYSVTRSIRVASYTAASVWMAGVRCVSVDVCRRCNLACDRFFTLVMKFLETPFWRPCTLAPGDICTPLPPLRYASDPLITYTVMSSTGSTSFFFIFSFLFLPLTYSFHISSFNLLLIFLIVPARCCDHAHYHTFLQDLIYPACFNV